jgi:isopentenyl-diphosphate delta-isomerase
MQETQLVLVNERDEPLGTMEKMEAHRKALLHRAFSVFIFNTEGEMLLQRRAFSKYHSGGLWTNTCCSHPYPGETPIEAASRRLMEEMGFTTGLEKIFDFIYKKELDNELTEHEFDHVFVGQYEGLIQPNPEEVVDFQYYSMDEITTRMEHQPEEFTVWFQIAFPRVKEWMSAVEMNQV